MKLKKIIYILLVLALLPSFCLAEDYPYLPTMLKEKLISAFGINTAGKTMLYEKVNIYEDFDAWMIGWFDNETKIIAGITDTEDIIYYNISSLGGNHLPGAAQSISHEQGEQVAYEFLSRIMPRAEPVLKSSGAFEYTFVDTYNSIPILGREATVVVDKSAGEVVYYKGFGQTDCNFIKLTNGLISPEYAFEIYYDKIGLELVYNTVFDHSSRTKAVRPMYILDRSDFCAVDAQNGKPLKVSMHDYNFYYNDDFFSPNYYYDNNIYTEQKIFSPDVTVSASSYKISTLLNTPGLGLSEGYCGKVVPGRLTYYTDMDGSINSQAVLQVDVVPLSHAIDIYKFCEKFDSGNSEWFNTVSCRTPLVFARAYVDATSGNILDFESVKNSGYIPGNTPEVSYSDVENFVFASAPEEKLKYYGTKPADNGLSHIVFARYVNDARVIGEGASVVVDASLGTITDYTLSVSNTNFLSPSFMKSHQQMKEFAREELNFGLFYVDKNKFHKFVVYDATDPDIAFDPVTGDRINRLDHASSVMVVCRVGEESYTLSGTEFSAPAPIISSDKLFIPIDVISASFGYSVSAGESEVTLSDGKDVITLIPHQTTCTVGGNKLELDAAPIRTDNTVYLSAGSLRSLFGMFISWDITTNNIYLIR